MTLQLFKDVHCLDFSALYPNIIRQANLSPEFEYSVNYDANKDDNLVIKSKEFNYSKTGILPQLATKLINLRKDYRSKGMEAEQLACKIAVNSMYGVLSQNTAKYVLGGTHLASTVTYIGRTILHNLVKELPKEDLTVIYGKTDSIFVITKEPMNEEEVLKIGQEATNKIVEKLTRRENKYIIFDYEEHLTHMALVNKNNYVKFYEDGSKKMKGGTFWSSKSSEYELDVMEYLLSEIVSNETFYRNDIQLKAKDFLIKKMKTEDIDYFAIKHKPRESIINKFDNVDYMISKDINIEYGYNHNAVICNYDGNKEGVLVYPLGYEIEDKYKPNRRWLESINRRIINKLTLPEKQKQISLDRWI